MSGGYQYGGRDQSVALGHYATVLFVLGMVERLSDLADVTHDATGLHLEDELLPKRIRSTRRRRREPAKLGG